MFISRSSLFLPSIPSCVPFKAFTGQTLPKHLHLYTCLFVSENGQEIWDTWLVFSFYALCSLPLQNNQRHKYSNVNIYMDVVTTSSTNRSTKQLLLSSCGLCWHYLYNISAPEKEHKRKKTKETLVSCVCVYLTLVTARLILFTKYYVGTLRIRKPWTVKKIEDELKK